MEGEKCEAADLVLNFNQEPVKWEWASKGTLKESKRAKDHYKTAWELGQASIPDRYIS